MRIPQESRAIEVGAVILFGPAALRLIGSWSGISSYALDSSMIVDWNCYSQSLPRKLLPCLLKTCIFMVGINERAD